MNPKRTIRRVNDLPEDSRLAWQHAAATAKRIHKNPTPDQTHAKRTPDKLPDPWLFNSESLLREMDRCRELVLQIPIADHHATHFGINVAIEPEREKTLLSLIHIPFGALQNHQCVQKKIYVTESQLSGDRAKVVRLTRRS